MPLHATLDAQVIKYPVTMRSTVSTTSIS